MKLDLAEVLKPAPKPLPRIEFYESGGKWVVLLINHKGIEKGQTFDTKTGALAMAMEFKAFLDWPIVKVER
jgi:hypothetical protein